MVQSQSKPTVRYRLILPEDSANNVSYSCSCEDFTQFNYPCKHFFAVMRVYPAVTWEHLGRKFLSSSRMCADLPALDRFALEVGNDDTDRFDSALQDQQGDGSHDFIDPAEGSGEFHTIAQVPRYSQVLHANQVWPPCCYMNHQSLSPRHLSSPT
jgi:hypothetical protein